MASPSSDYSSHMLPTSMMPSQPAGSSSGFKGVTLDKNDGRFRVRINAGCRRIFLGKYPTAELAACAYDRAAVLLMGHDAKTNFGPAAALACKEGESPLKPDMEAVLSDVGQQLAQDKKRKLASRMVAKHQQQQHQQQQQQRLVEQQRRKLEQQQQQQQSMQAAAASEALLRWHSGVDDASSSMCRSSSTAAAISAAATQHSPTHAEQLQQGFASLAGYMGMGVATTWRSTGTPVAGGAALLHRGGSLTAPCASTGCNAGGSCCGSSGDNGGSGGSPLYQDACLPHADSLARSTSLLAPIMKESSSELDMPMWGDQPSDWAAAAAAGSTALSTSSATHHCASAAQCHVPSGAPVLGCSSDGGGRGGALSRPLSASADARQSALRLLMHVHAEAPAIPHLPAQGMARGSYSAQHMKPVAVAAAVHVHTAAGTPGGAYGGGGGGCAPHYGVAHYYAHQQQRANNGGGGSLQHGQPPSVCSTRGSTAWHAGGWAPGVAATAAAAPPWPTHAAVSGGAVCYPAAPFCPPGPAPMQAIPVQPVPVQPTPMVPVPLIESEDAIEATLAAMCAAP